VGFNSLQVGQDLQQCCYHANWGALTLGALPSHADPQAGQRLWLLVYSLGRSQSMVIHSISGLWASIAGTCILSPDRQCLLHPCSLSSCWP
jgi:hypothetical protein